MKLVRGEIVQWQKDWGEEFDGSNPAKLRELEMKYYLPFGARLVKIPKGHKDYYNGRVKRSHLTDDDEFYIPFLLEINGKQVLLKKLQAWQYIYNAKCPHFGYDMNGRTPLEKLRALDYDVDERFAMLPVVLLDKISSDYVLRISGNDVLAADTLLKISILTYRIKWL